MPWLMRSHTGAELGVGQPLPSWPQAFTVLTYASRFRIALMSTKYGPNGTSRHRQFANFPSPVSSQERSVGLSLVGPGPE